MRPRRKCSASPRPGGALAPRQGWRVNERMLQGRDAQGRRAAGDSPELPESGEGELREPRGGALLRAVLRGEWARAAARCTSSFRGHRSARCSAAWPMRRSSSSRARELDLVWLVVGYVGLGLTLLSPLLGAASPRRGSSCAKPRQRRRDPLVLETGPAPRAGFALPLALVHAARPAALALDSSRRGATIERDREHGALCERVQLGERGRFDAIERRVALLDPFGLSRVVLRMRQARAVDVLPRLAGLSRPALAARARVGRRRAASDGPRGRRSDRAAPLHARRSRALHPLEGAVAHAQVDGAHARARAVGGAADRGVSDRGDRTTTPSAAVARLAIERSAARRRVAVRHRPRCVAGTDACPTPRSTR